MTLASTVRSASLSTPLLTFFLTAAAIAAPAKPATIAACSTNSGTSYSYPAGPEHAESVTFVVIGAPAQDVTALLPCLSHSTGKETILPDEPGVINTAWLGLASYNNTDSGNTVGSTRSSTLGTTEGVYDVTEKHTKLFSRPNGAFLQRFEQLTSTLPLEYYDKSGSFQGYWITFETKRVFRIETAIVSSV
ncbi:MAG: hypothetical protein LQ346_005443 [Caloplaca aetnensis]|nr:MAG: hypothetical protein LQ346_005443 [Caloplaca aetnensis]